MILKSIDNRRKWFVQGDFECDPTTVRTTENDLGSIKVLFDWREDGFPTRKNIVADTTKRHEKLGY